MDACRAENMQFFKSFKEGLKVTQHGIQILRVRPVGLLPRRCERVCRVFLKRLSSEYRQRRRLKRKKRERYGSLVSARPDMNSNPRVTFPRPRPTPHV